MANATTTSQANKQELLRKAITHLQEIHDSWNEDDVEVYESRLSFDELIAELRSIEFKK